MEGERGDRGRQEERVAQRARHRADAEGEQAGAPAPARFAHQAARVAGVRHPRLDEALHPARALAEP